MALEKVLLIPIVGVWVLLNKILIRHIVFGHPDSDGGYSIIHVILDISFVNFRSDFGRKNNTEIFNKLFPVFCWCDPFEYNQFKSNAFKFNLLFEFVSKYIIYALFIYYMLTLHSSLIYIFIGHRFQIIMRIFSHFL